MKNKTLQFKNFLALLTWNSKQKCVYVAWFEILASGSLDDIKEWPSKEAETMREMEKYIGCETLLSKVREFCSDKNLRLWSY